MRIKLNSSSTYHSEQVVVICVPCVFELFFSVFVFVFIDLIQPLATICLINVLCLLMSLCMILEIFYPQRLTQHEPAVCGQAAMSTRRKLGE